MTWQGLLHESFPSPFPPILQRGPRVPTGPCHPRGKDRGRRIHIGHFDKMRNAKLFADRSRNGRLVTRCTDADGVLQTYRVLGRKSVRLNRLPRGSKRRTGVWNGQNVADMVSR